MYGILQWTKLFGEQFVDEDGVTLLFATVGEAQDALIKRVPGVLPSPGKDCQYSFPPVKVVIDEELNRGAR